MTTAPAAPAGGVPNLPEDVRSWMEEATGRPLLRADRIPGGGMREGWFVDFGFPGGRVEHLFLRYSPQRFPADSVFHTLATEAEVVRALGRAGMRVAAVHAVHPTREAVLLERVPGETWFYRITDPAEQVSVAQDFVRALARVHQLDPRSMDLPSLGPVRSAREHALERIAAVRARATAADGSIDPLVRLSVDWLERNVPDYEGPVVLVQGDTGPGNFLYLDGRVTAVVDWELCHFGDPMDDIAWLSLRTVQDTFTHLPDRLAEYEKLSGHPLDVDRIWYYRVFAETTMATLVSGHEARSGPSAASPAAGPAAAAAPSARVASRDLANAMIYSQLHRRLWLEALNTVMGMGLTAPATPEPGEPSEWLYLFDDALAMLRGLTPRVADPLAAQWSKGVARILRQLREVGATGREHEAAERDHLGRLLGHAPDSLTAGRAELEAASRRGEVPDEDYVRYLWDKVFRDDHLMRHASGALHRRSWPPLS